MRSSLDFRLYLRPYLQDGVRALPEDGVSLDTYIFNIFVDDFLYRVTTLSDEDGITLYKSVDCHVCNTYAIHSHDITLNVPCLAGKAHQTEGEYPKLRETAYKAFSFRQCVFNHLSN